MAGGRLDNPDCRAMATTHAAKKGELNIDIGTELAPCTFEAEGRICNARLKVGLNGLEGVGIKGIGCLFFENLATAGHQDESDQVEDWEGW